MQNTSGRSLILFSILLSIIGTSGFFIKLQSSLNHAGNETIFAYHAGVLQYAFGQPSQGEKLGKRGNDLPLPESKHLTKKYAVAINTMVLSMKNLPARTLHPVKQGIGILAIRILIFPFHSFW